MGIWSANVLLRHMLSTDCLFPSVHCSEKGLHRFTFVSNASGKVLLRRDSSPSHTDIDIKSYQVNVCLDVLHFPAVQDLWLQQQYQQNKFQMRHRIQVVQREFRFNTNQHGVSQQNSSSNPFKTLIENNSPAIQQCCGQVDVSHFSASKASTTLSSLAKTRPGGISSSLITRLHK